VGECLLTECPVPPPSESTSCSTMPASRTAMVAYSTALWVEDSVVQATILRGEATMATMEVCRQYFLICTALIGILALHVAEYPKHLPTGMYVTC